MRYIFSPADGGCRTSTRS